MSEFYFVYCIFLTNPKLNYIKNPNLSLSPPKCKQLISSFLSSCRILGCKNNGRCINMAYKYPIPYVCSCPSGYMGSYCEIATADPKQPENNNGDYIDETEQLFNDLTKTDPTTPIDYDEHRSMRILTSSADHKKNSKTLKSTTWSLELETSTVPIRHHHQVSHKSPCEPNPCMNQGVCVLISSESYICKCLNSSFSGQYCQMVNMKTTTTTTRLGYIFSLIN